MPIEKISIGTVDLFSFDEGILETRGLKLTEHLLSIGPDAIRTKLNSIESTGSILRRLFGFVKLEESPDLCSNESMLLPCFGNQCMTSLWLLAMPSL